MKARNTPIHLAFILILFVLGSGNADADDNMLAVGASVGAGILAVGDDDLQSVIEAAPPHTTIICDPNRQLTVSTPILITKPLAIKGLNANLPEGLGGQSILEIRSKGVTVSDFVLRGNARSVPQSERAALITVYTGDFLIERGKLFDSSKDGIEVDKRDFSDPIEGGVIRDIFGRGCVRDVISLGGPGGPETHLKNVLVENIRGYSSELKGVVEVSDGASNVTVRNVYAEDCVYAVDIQDHNKKEINRNIMISGVYALRCKHAVRTANNPNGHVNLSLENITAENCQNTMFIRYTDNVSIRNVRIIDYSGRKAAITLSRCNGLQIRDVAFINCNSNREGLLLKNCNDVTIDGVQIVNSGSLNSAVSYWVSGDTEFKNLMIRNVSAIDAQEAGIILLKTEDQTSLNGYLISDNIATVADGIKGTNYLIKNNLPTDGQ